MVSGLLNKQAVAELGITNSLTRLTAKVMHKIKAASLANLVRIAGKNHISGVHCRRVKSPKEDESSEPNVDRFGDVPRRY